MAGFRDPFKVGQAVGAILTVAVTALIVAAIIYAGYRILVAIGGGC
jgi:hypothetical protein